MTNSEAKLILQANVMLACERAQFGTATFKMVEEALDMAIEALSNSQNQTESLIRTSADAVSEADVIYRRDAIEINKSYHGRMPNEVNHCIWKEINDLPSAQPDIIRCKDCKHYQGEDSWFHCNRVTWLNGEDDFCSRAERKENG